MKYFLCPLAFLLLLSLPAYAQDEVDSFDAVDLDHMEEQSQEDDINQVVFRDQETGLEIKDFNADNDQKKISLVYHVNKDLTSITDVQNIEALYAMNFGDYWVEAFYLYANVRFSEVVDASNMTDQDKIASSDQAQAFGVAISYRGKWVQNLLGSSNLFSYTSVGLGYYSYEHAYENQSYTGVGYRADYTLSYRHSPTVHSGLKMSYHIAPLTRAAEFDGETSSQRSITASWLTLGYDLTLYF